jgi:hypothetical protein
MLPTRARFDDAVDGFVDAAVDAQRQAVAGGVDGVDDLVELVGLEAQHVQHRAEVLAVSSLTATDLDDRRGEEGAVRAGRPLARAARRCGRLAHAAMWASSLALASASITGPTSVRQQAGIADDQRCHRAASMSSMPS